MIINDLFNNKKFVAEDTQADSQRKQYPNYYQHRDAGTVFRTQNADGQTMDITPDDEEWDDYYKQQFPDYPTPNDGGFWNADNTAAYVEESAGKVVFSGTGADGGKYEIIQSSPTDFMIHANGRHIDTYGSLQRAMSVLKNEVPGLQQGMSEGWKTSAAVGAGLGGLAGGIPGAAVGALGGIAHNQWSNLIKKSKEQSELKKQQDELKRHLEDPETKEFVEIYNKWMNYFFDLWDHYDRKLEASGSSSDGAFRLYQIYKEKIEQDVWSASGTYGDRTNTLKYYITDFKKKLENTEPEMPTESNQQGVAEDDGFDVVSNYADMRSTEKGGKSNQTFTSTAIAKNPATGQQKSMASWDYTDPKTGKNYSGSNYIDPQGNAEVQKNYEESKNKVNEVSLGDYRKKAMMSKAMAQTNRFFDRDNPAAVAAADRTIANRTKGLAGADARRRPYTQPPVDQDKQRRDLADKYPNIDELVRQAELNRDPDYDRAEGNAYYAGRDAEHNYHRLKQIQRMIRGAELDEMNFGGVGQVTDSDTGDVTTSFNQGPISVSQTKTPGGYTKQTDQRFDLGPATITQKTVGPNIGAGQLAGTTTKTATNNMTGQAQQQVKGVGFGGATGANVGKNYVGSSDDELVRHAASVFNTNESVDRITHLAGIKPVR